MEVRDKDHDRLAKDLKQEFSEMKGFSRSNLKHMRSFTEASPEGEFGQRRQGGTALAAVHFVIKVSR
jgi:hypothetical protein